MFRLRFSTNPKSDEYLVRSDLKEYLDSAKGKLEARHWLISCALYFAQNQTEPIFFQKQKALSSSVVHPPVKKQDVVSAVVKELFSPNGVDTLLNYAVPPMPSSSKMTVDSFKATCKKEIWGISNKDLDCLIISALQAAAGPVCVKQQELKKAIWLELGHIPLVFVETGKGGFRFQRWSPDTEEIESAKTTGIINVKLTEKGKNFLRKKN